MTYYGIGNQESLDAEIGDCIQNYLDMCDPDNMPEAITVDEYEQAKASVNVDSMLEQVYEWLDDEYGNPDDDSTVPPECVVEKAHELADLILANYHVWRCEKNGMHYNVDVKKYVAGEQDAITMMESQI
jgi:hypothetical protein